MPFVPQGAEPVHMDQLFGVGPGVKEPTGSPIITVGIPRDKIYFLTMNEPIFIYSYENKFEIDFSVVAPFGFL